MDKDRYYETKLETFSDVSFIGNSSNGRESFNSVIADLRAYSKDLDQADIKVAASYNPKMEEYMPDRIMCKFLKTSIISDIVARISSESASTKIGIIRTLTLVASNKYGRTQLLSLDILNIVLPL